MSVSSTQSYREACSSTGSTGHEGGAGLPMQRHEGLPQGMKRFHDAARADEIQLKQSLFELVIDAVAGLRSI